MPLLGFEPVIPMFKWVKTAHALDHVATVIGMEVSGSSKMSLSFFDF
jgi:hypothetical protein